MYKIAEQAKQRKYIIDKCEELGKLFIEHFNKTFEAGPEDRDFKHHCGEMQTWLDRVRSYTLAQNNKHLNVEEMINWFFTAGSSFEDVTIYTEYYDKLVVELLADKTKTVEDVMNTVFNMN